MAATSTSADRAAPPVLAMIGLGRMGANLLRRLARAGFPVSGYDVSAAAGAALAEDRRGQRGFEPGSGRGCAACSARRLDHAAGRRDHRTGGAGGGGTALTGRCHHRGRQHRLSRQRAARRCAQRAGRAFRRRGRIGRHLGLGERLWAHVRGTRGGREASDSACFRRWPRPRTGAGCTAAPPAAGTLRKWCTTASNTG